MKTIKPVSFLNLLLLFSSCNSQTKPIGEATLDLSNFDFNVKITTLYPDKNKSKEYTNYYNISTKYNTILVEKDTTFLENYSEQKKASGFTYLQKNSSNVDTLAVFEKQVFNKINIATTLKNEIMVISAVADEMSENDNETFIKLLTDKYGKCLKTEGEFIGKFFIYEWQTNKNFIRFSTIRNNESNTLKIVIDKEKQTLNTGIKEPHYEGYFYIIKKEYLKNIKTLKTGDFVYVN